MKDGTKRFYRSTVKCLGEEDRSVVYYYFDARPAGAGYELTPPVTGCGPFYCDPTQQFLAISELERYLREVYGLTEGFNIQVKKL